MKMDYKSEPHGGVVFLATFLQLLLYVTGDANSYIQDAKALSVPRFLSTNTNVNKDAGDTAVLECAVENLGDKKIVWRKASETTPLTVGNDLFVDDPRIEAEHPPGSSQWNLIIRDLKSQDSGLYECQISSTFKHLRHHVTLLVKDEPKPDPRQPNIQITGANFVDEGERIYLVCNATAIDQPPDDLDWFRDGSKLQTSEEHGVLIRKFVTLSTGTIFSILEIKHARLKDAGMYVCRTSSLDVTSFRVNVLNGDTFNVKRGTETENADENSPRSVSGRQNGLSSCALLSFTVVISGFFLSVLT